MVAQLATRGVKAVPSYRFAPDAGAVEQVKLEQAVKEAGVSGVLLTRVVNVTEQVNVTPGMVMGPPMGYGFGGFYGYYGGMWATSYYMPPTVYTTQHVAADTRLFETGNLHAGVVGIDHHHAQRRQRGLDVRAVQQADRRLDGQGRPGLTRAAAAGCTRVLPTALDHAHAWRRRRDGASLGRCGAGPAGRLRQHAAARRAAGPGDRHTARWPSSRPAARPDRSARPRAACRADPQRRPEQALRGAGPALHAAGRRRAGDSRPGWPPGTAASSTAGPPPAARSTTCTRSSAAHRTMPIPSYALVRNPANGREMVVRVNDRGPFHSDAHHRPELYRRAQARACCAAWRRSRCSG